MIDANKDANYQQSAQLQKCRAIKISHTLKNNTQKSPHEISAGKM
jgi:hypothetical protein